ncbi:alpha/beta hydrolase [Actinoplanes sp. NPDC026619]|uniref:alpha/beta fold hydrolase n=1 Tax=Actinoplanes sp. NPDC026619 TaxID=3155798 RepID=UPI0033EEFA2A
MRRRILAALSVAALTLAGGTAAHAATHGVAKPTVVLVHGAWADSSSWDGVVERLLHDGYPVGVFATPLRSLSGDSAALRDYLAAVSGPIVLVGHSYGGAVITNAATGNTAVQALVYVDAFAPAAGVPVIALPGPDSALTDPAILQFVPAGAPTPTTDLYIDKALFPAVFANDLPASKGRILAVTQRPVTYGALTEPSGPPAWQSIPSWYEVGTKDKVIPAAVQKQMATAIGAHVRSAATGHLPMVSHPADVTATIESAAKGTTK